MGTKNDEARRRRLAELEVQISAYDYGDRPSSPPAQLLWEWRQLTRDQVAAPGPPPTGNGRKILDLVLTDLKSRSAVGELEYGTPLRAHNGRDALLDAYQEALDLCMYLRQAIEERDKNT